MVGFVRLNQGSPRMTSCAIPIYGRVCAPEPGKSKESHLSFKEDGDATAPNIIGIDWGRTNGDLTVVAEKPPPVNRSDLPAESGI